MKGVQWAGGWLAVVSLAGSAAATTVLPVSLGKAVSRADVIVQARVERVDVGWGLHQGQPAILSQVWLADEVVLKGERLGSLTLFGGQVGEQRMTLEGQPELRVGEQVFLFVLEQQVQCPFVGVWQGVYRIDAGVVSRAGRAVVDVVADDVVLAHDGERGMRAQAFTSEVERLIATGPSKVERVEVAVESGLKTLRLSAPRPRLGPHAHAPSETEAKPGSSGLVQR